MTQRQLAAQHGISPGTLQNWLRRDREQSGSAPSHGWLEVVAEAPSPAEAYRIELPRGRALVLGPRWRAAEVRELLSLLTES
jgi:transposase-like protein